MADATITPSPVAGLATVDLPLVFAFAPIDGNRYLYLLTDVGVGFDDTDDNSASTGYVSQSYADGTVIGQNRYLHLLTDAGVGFDDTDDNSGSTGYVSQSYPEGTLIRNRYLYLLTNVIASLRRLSKTFSSMTVSNRPRPFGSKPPRTWV